MQKIPLPGWRGGNKLMYQFPKTVKEINKFLDTIILGLITKIQQEINCNYLGITGLDGAILVLRDCSSPPHWSFTMMLIPCLSKMKLLLHQGRWKWSPSAENNSGIFTPTVKMYKAGKRKSLSCKWKYPDILLFSVKIKILLQTQTCSPDFSDWRDCTCL